MLNPETRWAESEGKSVLMQGMKIIATVKPDITELAWCVMAPMRGEPVVSGFTRRQCRSIAESLLP